MLKSPFSVNKLLILLVFVIASSLQLTQAQQKYKSATVAFYNIENVFDTLASVGYIDGNLPFNDPNYHISISRNDIAKYDTVGFNQEYNYDNLNGKRVIRPLILQDEFLPKGTKVWTSERYFIKVNNIAKAISEIGYDLTQNAPVIIGICEIENKQNLIDITQSQYLAKYNYGVVHFNSFDARGVDVGLLYQKDRFVVKYARPYPIVVKDETGSRKYTRDILRVTGLLDGEEITFLVNHWPSRSGGEQLSLSFRMEAARVARSIFDEIKQENPNAKIMAMGDLNDDPTSKSIKTHFDPAPEKSKVIDGGFYDPMIALYKKGKGTLAYRDSWNLFDQMISTSTLISKDNTYKTYGIYKTEIFNPDYLKSSEGQYKGYPQRTFSGDTFRANGYSDHFPVYTILLRSTN